MVIISTMAARIEYLTVEDVAAVTRAAVGSVRRWIRSGRLRSFRPGKRRRVRRDHLIAFIEGKVRQ